MCCVWGGGGALFELSFVADVLHTWFCRDPDGCGHVKMHVHVQPSLSHTCTILVLQAHLYLPLSSSAASLVLTDALFCTCTLCNCFLLNMIIIIMTVIIDLELGCMG